MVRPEKKVSFSGGGEGGGGDKFRSTWSLGILTMRKTWSYLARSGGQQYQTSSRLRNSVRSCLKHAEGALIAHADEASQRQFQDHAAFEGDEISHVLQDEKLGPIIIAIGEVSDDQRVLKGGILSMVEPVHSAEALARRTSAQQLHLALQRQTLALVARLPFHGEFEEKITVFGKNGTVGIVLLKGFGGAFYLLDRPQTLGDTRLMQAFGKASAPGEDVQTFQRTRSGRQWL